MPRLMRRWLRVALWVVPLLALGAGICRLPIWPVRGVAGHFEALCSAAASVLHLAQTAAAPARAVAAPAAPAAAPASGAAAAPAPA
ncbi:MAG: hypothetical protein ACREE2_12180, partial [Stellaceae bacterium]